MNAFNHVVKTLLRTRGYEVRREPNLGDFLRNRNCDLVVDVGANIGQFASSLRPLGYRGRIQSVEPLDSAIVALRAAAAHDPLWSVAQLALGDTPGQMEINVSRNTVYSSFLPLARLADKFENTEITHKQVIQVETLDNFMDGLSCERPFIKIDTQGFERQVLAGGPKTLQRCVGLLLELPVDHLYENVWSFAEAIGYLDGIGFKLAQIQQVNCRADGDYASALEFDCLFRRA